MTLQDNRETQYLSYLSRQTMPTMPTEFQSQIFELKIHMAINSSTRLEAYDDISMHTTVMGFKLWNFIMVMSTPFKHAICTYCMPFTPKTKLLPAKQVSLLACSSLSACVWAIWAGLNLCKPLWPQVGMLMLSCTRTWSRNHGTNTTTAALTLKPPVLAD